MAQNDEASSSKVFATPLPDSQTYTDNRAQWEWTSKYPPEARSCINTEAYLLAGLLIVLSILVAALLGLSSNSIQYPIDLSLHLSGGGQILMTIEFRLLMIYAAGSLGGVTFSIKWLIHTTARGKWHLDRRYWRLFVPLIGGVYACVVLSLLDSGVIGGQTANQVRSIGLTAAFAFLVGYFSDGVSGLLSNVANAVFGTLEKK